MGVEAGGEEDRVGTIGVDDPDDLVFDGGEVRDVAFAAIERNVVRVAASLADADLVRGAGAGIERVAMHRGVEDVIAVVKEMLGSVAVVDIEVEDEDPLDARL